MKERPYIMVVDDDPNISRLVELYLEKENFEVRSVSRGDDAVNEFHRLPPDLILLDVMLPGMDGYQVLTAVRKSGSIPVIMLTARDETFDKVTGLDMGADDYITKPFRPRELVSRIRSVLRRSGAESVLLLGNGVTVDPDRGVVTKDGGEIKLSALEFRLLMAFLNHRGKLMTREKLLEDIWDIVGDFVNDNTLTVYIKRLRVKLGDDPQDPQIIKTVRGIGYRMD